MRGMRNRMTHGYFDIDLNIVWDTVQLSLQELEDQVAAALSQIKQGLFSITFSSVLKAYE
jgi:uncharacterized protein with HEPN domain